MFHFFADTVIEAFQKDITVRPDFDDSITVMFRER
jgi:hypothetical protein